MHTHEVNIVLSPSEISMIKTLAIHGPVSSELISNVNLLESLTVKGFVEKIHQEKANIDRYRLTTLGITEYRNIYNGYF